MPFIVYQVETNSEPKILKCNTFEEADAHPIAEIAFLTAILEEREDVIEYLGDENLLLQNGY